MEQSINVDKILEIFPSLTKMEAKLLLKSNDNNFHKTSVFLLKNVDKITSSSPSSFINSNFRVQHPKKKSKKKFSKTFGRRSNRRTKSLSFAKTIHLQLHEYITSPKKKKFSKKLKSPNVKVKNTSKSVEKPVVNEPDIVIQEEKTFDEKMSRLSSVIEEKKRKRMKLTQVPKEVFIEYIFMFCKLNEIGALGSVCKYFNSLSKNEFFWFTKSCSHRVIGFFFALESFIPGVKYYSVYKFMHVIFCFLRFNNWRKNIKPIMLLNEMVDAEKFTNEIIVNGNMKYFKIFYMLKNFLEFKRCFPVLGEEILMFLMSVKGATHLNIILSYDHALSGGFFESLEKKDFVVFVNALAKEDDFSKYFLSQFPKRKIIPLLRNLRLHKLVDQSLRVYKLIFSDWFEIVTNSCSNFDVFEELFEEVRAVQEFGVGVFSSNFDHLKFFILLTLRDVVSLFQSTEYHLLKSYYNANVEFVLENEKIFCKHEGVFNVFRNKYVSFELKKKFLKMLNLWGRGKNFRWNLKRITELLNSFRDQKSVLTLCADVIFDPNGLNIHNHLTTIGDFEVILNCFSENNIEDRLVFMLISDQKLFVSCVVRLFYFISFVSETLQSMENKERIVYVFISHKILFFKNVDSTELLERFIKFVRKVGFSENVLFKIYKKLFNTIVFSSETFHYSDYQSYGDKKCFNVLKKSEIFNYISNVEELETFLRYIPKKGFETEVKYTLKNVVNNSPDFFLLVGDVDGLKKFDELSQGKFRNEIMLKLLSRNRKKNVEESENSMKPKEIDFFSFVKNNIYEVISLVKSFPEYEKRIFDVCLKEMLLKMDHVKDVENFLEIFPSYESIVVEVYSKNS